MERTSTANDLSDRLRQRLENERREIEELTVSELGRPDENSRRAARNALRTIGRDTVEAAARMHTLPLKARSKPPIFGLNRSPGISAEGWATMRWLWRSIQARIETRAESDFEIAETRRTLARIEMVTWRNALPKIEDEQAVVRPSGTLDKPRWTWRGRPV